MKIQIDFRSGLPIYEQIVEQIRRKIINGELKPGDQLPTVREMAIELRVNFNTIARAYRILDEMGLISTQQGRGTYVWESPSAETNQRLRRQVLDELTNHYIQEARNLGFDLTEVTTAVECQWQFYQSGGGNEPSNILKA